MLARRLAWLLLAIVLPLAVYAPQLRARLDVRQDDHRIVFGGSPVPLHDQVLAQADAGGEPLRADVVQQIRVDARTIGRFRPLGTALEVLMPRFFGTDAFAWHAALAALTALTVAALFALGWRWFGSAPIAAAFALFIVLAPDPGPAKVWYMVSVKAELLGTLLAALTLLLIERAARGGRPAREDAWALVFALTAALLKEPYILLLPAYALLRVYAHRRVTAQSLTASLRALRAPLLAWAIAFALLMACVLAVLRMAPRDSYGGASLDAGSSWAAGMAQTLALLPSQAVWFLPLVLALVVLLHRRARDEWREAAWLLALAAGWWGPQMLLYATRGGMWDHYWLPGLMAIASLDAAALAYVARHARRPLRALAAVAVVLWMLNGARTNYAAADNFAARTRALDEAVAAVAAGVPERGRVVIVASRSQLSEFAQSWVLFLGLHGRPHVRVDLYDTDARGEARMAALAYFPRRDALADVAACEVDAVVFLDTPASSDAVWRAWWRPGCFRHAAITAPQRFFSVRRMQWVQDAYRLEFALK